jgi:ABC-type polysaccharide/polyol phosphate transport system ATPase subunit
MTTAVSLEHVGKTFRVHSELNQSWKKLLLRRRRSTFQQFVALEDINVEISTGETFGFIGHNGSGKSTLLKLIAGIIEPDSGKVHTAGRVSALLELGAGFHPELSGRENVFLNGALLGLTTRAIKQRFDEIVDFAGMGEFIDQPVKHYSSGMYARLGFAVAVNVDPDILLIDEVLSVGDEEFGRRCAEKISDFRRDGKTVIIVTHALGVARTMCDRVASLSHGKLTAIGGSRDVIDSYLDSIPSHESVAAPPGAVGKRTGNGAMLIRSVQITGTGPDGRLSNGAGALVRIAWDAHRPTPVAGFGIAISTIDGTIVSATNTRDSGHEVIISGGSGEIGFEIPSLPLLPGRYSVEVSANSERLDVIFDKWEHALEIEVVKGDDSGSTGLVSLGGRWWG